ncbi:MAG: flagellar biosynthesis anti-sigma factor FlgM [Dehalococcoidia bacterium]|nr:flagellar biosynthesis anti-sigma factor FlgM [Dehalococcoidia bacterium]
MSIESTQGPTQAGSITDIRQKAAAKQSTASGREERTDSAGITENARELGRARESVEAAPDIRENRVRALRAAIANGTYQADPEEVARRLLDRGFDSP